jgi:hypothetical protein
MPPTFSDLIANVNDCDFEPSAKTYVCSPIISLSLIVLARLNVEKTSAGTLTSAAPLSTVKSSVIAPLISTDVDLIYRAAAVREFTDESVDGFLVAAENEGRERQEITFSRSTGSGKRRTGIVIVRPGASASTGVDLDKTKA